MQSAATVQNFAAAVALISSSLLPIRESSAGTKQRRLLQVIGL
jgi:hypothetical protein